MLIAHLPQGLGKYQGLRASPAGCGKSQYQLNLANFDHFFGPADYVMKR